MSLPLRPSPGNPKCHCRGTIIAAPPCSHRCTTGTPSPHMRTCHAHPEKTACSRGRRARAIAAAVSFPSPRGLAVDSYFSGDLVSLFPVHSAHAPVIPLASRCSIHGEHTIYPLGAWGNVPSIPVLCFDASSSLILLQCSALTSSSLVSTFP